MADHAFCSFRGVTAHLESQLVFAHGTSPSQIQISVPPTPGIEVGGPFVISQGGTSVTLLDCKVDRVEVITTGEGLVYWTLVILDRRWKWKECGQVSGYYNVREGENASAEAGIPKTIKKGTEKNVRDLMKLCLEAMGETGYNLSQVPTDIYPEVEWDYTNAAEALAKLADPINFRIVLSHRRNRVELWPDGKGQLLTSQNAMEYQLTIDPPERPDKLIFVGHRMLWEIDLELEAVCRSQSNEYLPINHPAIDYKPDVESIDGNYWHEFDPEFGNAIFDKPVVTVNGVKTLRDLAKADVYRKYRIKTPIRVNDESVDDLDRILPLLATRLSADLLKVTKDKPAKAKPPVVWGVFSRDEAAPDDFKKISGPNSKIDANGDPPKEMTVEDGWQLDEKTGIITFDKPRYRYGKGTMAIKDGEGKTVDNVNKWQFQPAQLFLRIGFGLRDAKTRAWLHKEIERKSPEKKFGTKPRYITADDAIYKNIMTAGGQPKKNDVEYADIAKHYLDLAEKKYETKTPAAATYPGIQPWDLDGAIQQVTWSITERGATTRVSRNREEPVLGLTYGEQRLYQQLKAKIDGDASTSRELADRAARRPA